MKIQQFILPIIAVRHELEQLSANPDSKIASELEKSLFNPKSSSAAAGSAISNR